MFPVRNAAANSHSERHGERGVGAEAAQELVLGGQELRGTLVRVGGAVGDGEVDEAGVSQVTVTVNGSIQLQR